MAPWGSTGENPTTVRAQPAGGAGLGERRQLLLSSQPRCRELGNAAIASQRPKYAKPHSIYHDRKGVYFGEAFFVLLSFQYSKYRALRNRTIKKSAPDFRRNQIRNEHHPGRAAKKLGRWKLSARAACAACEPSESDQPTTAMGARTSHKSLQAVPT